MVKDFRFLQVRVEPALMEALKNAAWKRRCSVTQLVTTILTAFVAAVDAQESTPESSLDDDAGGGDGKSGAETNSSDTRA